MGTQVTVETITTDRAIEMLARMSYSNQRGVSKQHVDFLAKEMQRDAFKQDTAIELSSANGEWFLTDGQHRLSAVVSSQKPQRFVVVRRTLQSDDDIAMDYTRTDKGRRRSVFDDYRVLSLDTELGLTQTQVNKFGAAINMIANQFKGPRGGIHTDERLKLMREYNDAYGTFLQIAAGCDEAMRGAIERSATLAVALVTFRHSVGKYGTRVEDFWNGTIWDDGLRAGDPRKVANKHLITVAMSGGGSRSRSIVSPAYSSRYLAVCFNTFAEDKSRKFARVPDMSSSIVILGSPFDGKDKQ